jgi:hypothetical protein
VRVELYAINPCLDRIRASIQPSDGHRIYRRSIAFEANTDAPLPAGRLYQPERVVAGAAECKAAAQIRDRDGTARGKIDARTPVQYHKSQRPSLASLGADYVCRVTRDQHRHKYDREQCLKGASTVHLSTLEVEDTNVLAHLIHVAEDATRGSAASNLNPVEHGSPVGEVRNKYRRTAIPFLRI